MGWSIYASEQAGLLTRQGEERRELTSSDASDDGEIDRSGRRSIDVEIHQNGREKRMTVQNE